MIPEAAVEAMSRHYSERTGVVPNASWMRDLLEAAAPHMLSHEREQTRLAHIDAVVNRDTVDRLEKELADARGGDGE